MDTIEQVRKELEKLLTPEQLQAVPIPLLDYIATVTKERDSLQRQLERQGNKLKKAQWGNWSR
jgi:hypothetical protein